MDYIWYADTNLAIPTTTLLMYWELMVNHKTVVPKIIVVITIVYYKCNVLDVL